MLGRILNVRWCHSDVIPAGFRGNNAIEPLLFTSLSAGDLGNQNLGHSHLASTETHRATKATSNNITVALYHREILLSILPKSLKSSKTKSETESHGTCARPYGLMVATIVPYCYTDTPTALCNNVSGS